ncbi:MAG: hypothetical protein IKH78_03160 [Ruminococcus sp.]|nr:hypothetical protein [Ruminococcus sp.]
MKWNYQQIRKQSWDTAFKKGRKSWFMLVVVAFLFAFIGASNSSQTTFIDTIDEYIGANDPLLPGNVDILKEYIVETPLVKNVPFITSDLALSVIDSITKGATWVFKLLAANLAYFNRNKGEVVAVLLIGALIAAVLKFFILNVALVGRNRYVMENRFSKEVPVRRIFASFHKDTLWNVVKVMFLYKLSIALWSLTFIGGFYKYYQYAAVPYLIAENPRISWREAKQLSVQMTNGCKWKMFLTQMSFLHIWLLKAIPLAGLLVAVPLEMSLNAEFYFTMRNDMGIQSELFCEPAFSHKPYIKQSAYPEYVLKDLRLSRPQLKVTNSCYGITDYIFMFFVFCLVGWLWECGLHIFRDHELVNRGTLNGPWIPIYGVGGTAMVLLLDRFKENKLKLVALEVAVCAVLEYLSSFILDFMFNASYWDYKTEFLNLNGRICFAGLTAFAIGGMAAIYLVAPALANISDKYSRKKRIIAASVLCGAFIIDIICCLIFGFNSGVGVGGSI